MGKAKELHIRMCEDERVAWAWDVAQERFVRAAAIDIREGLESGRFTNDPPGPDGVVLPLPVRRGKGHAHAEPVNPSTAGPLIPEPTQYRANEQGWRALAPHLVEQLRQQQQRPLPPEPTEDPPGWRERLRYAWLLMRRPDVAWRELRPPVPHPDTWLRREPARSVVRGLIASIDAERILRHSANTMISNALGEAEDAAAHLRRQLAGVRTIGPILQPTER